MSQYGRGVCRNRRSKHRPIIWNAQCATAFQYLKQALSKDPILALPEPGKPFLIETDASEWAIGYVLYQLDSSNQYHPVAFDGRKLQAAELNYPVHEKELLAIKEALRKWRNYVDNGTTTTVLTDHQSLQYLKTMKTPTKRLARWVEEFQQYNLDIKYRKGSEAVVPDAISRRPDFVPEDLAANVDNDWQQPAFVQQINAIGHIRGIPEDTFFKALREFKQTGSLPLNDRKLVEQIRQRENLFELDEDNQLWRLDPQAGTKAPYLTPELRWDLLEYAHQNYGHFGDPGLQGVLATRGWCRLVHNQYSDQYTDCIDYQYAINTRQPS